MAWEVLGESNAGSGRRRTDTLMRKVAALKADKKLTVAEKNEKVMGLKLAKALQGLAGKLDAKGGFRKGNVVVVDGKVTVAVYLNKIDADAVKELEAVGFKVKLKGTAVKMVLGTVDVGKLAELAWLDNVRRITPPDLK